MKERNYIIKVNKEKVLRIIKYFIGFILICLLYNYFTHNYDNRFKKSAEGFYGVNDLSTDYNGEVRFLEKGWEFYQYKYLTPDDFNLITMPDCYINIGSYSDFSLDNSEASPFGISTYRLNVILDGKQRNYCLEIPEIYSAYKLWVNGELLSQSGELGSQYKPEILRSKVNFIAKDNVQIVLNVANYDHIYSGLIYPPAFGEESGVNKFLSFRQVFNACQGFIALMLILAYGYMYFFQGKRNKKYILYALILLCFLGFGIYEVLYSIISCSGMVFYKLENISFILMLVLIVRLLGYIFYFSLDTYFEKGIILLGIITAVLSLITNVPVLLDIFKVTVMIYLIAVTFIALWREYANSKRIVFAVLFLGIAILFDRCDTYYQPVLFGMGAQMGGFVISIVLGSGLVRENIYLAKRNRELMDKDRKNKEYMSEVLHDLKSPLAGINAYIELNKKGLLTDDGVKNELLESMSEHTSNLAHRIEKLRQINPNELDNLVFEEFDALDYLKETSDKYRIIGENTGIKILVKGKHFPIKIDREKMDIAIENLIMNSLRYTDAGGSIVLETEKMDEGFRIIISDTGQGMDEKQINAIFRRGYTEDRTHSGLGLYIVSRIVKAHKGSVTVSSKKEKGSSFIIDIGKN